MIGGHNNQLPGTLFLVVDTRRNIGKWENGVSVLVSRRNSSTTKPELHPPIDSVLRVGKICTQISTLEKIKFAWLCLECDSCCEYDILLSLDSKSRTDSRCEYDIILPSLKSEARTTIIVASFATDLNLRSRT